jgi:uncharacterized protein (TIRG00374 family)
VVGLVALELPQRRCRARTVPVPDRPSDVLRLKLRGDCRVDDLESITERLNRPPSSPSVSRSAWRRYAKRIALLAVAGLSLYLFLPSLIAVFSSWRSLTHLTWYFAVLVVACEIASFVSLWQLDRIALHARGWFPIAAAQLSGNAVGRIVPGGGATATAFSVSMLRRAGVDTGDAAAAFAASAGLQLATTLALPVLALPAMIAGAPVSHSLATAAYLGIGVLVVLLAAGAAAFLTDAPLELAGRAIQWLLNATVRRRRHVTGLPQELLKARDFIRTTLGERWKGAVVAAAANTGFDYLALLCALRAVGADPRPSLVLLAYTTGELLALIPFTPGGLGFVEAGLVGTLTLAGVSGHAALAATLLYRLAAYWLPIPAGGLAYLLFRRRYGPSRGKTTEARDVLANSTSDDANER